MEISYNYQNGREEMVCRTCFKEIDRACRDIICERCQQWFLPFQVREEGGNYIFVYNIAGMINLRAWMDRATAEEQQRIRSEIMDVQRKLYEMGISEEQLLTQERHMYVDKNSGHIRFVCVPLMQDTGKADIDKPANNTTYVNPREYEMEEKLPLVPPAPSTDAVDMNYTNPEIEQPEMSGLSGRDEREDQAESLNYSWKQEKQENNQSIFPEFQKEATAGEQTVFGFVDRQENVSLEHVPEDDEDRTVLLKPEQDDEDATVLMNIVSRPTAFLCREATGENYRLNKDISIIGRSKTGADICIENVPEIGRKHCQIIWENGNYYLEDCDSLNGTYLDEKKLEAGERKLLQNKSRIRLANKAFIFKIG